MELCNHREVDAAVGVQREEGESLLITIPGFRSKADFILNISLVFSPRVPKAFSLQSLHSSWLPHEVISRHQRGEAVPSVVERVLQSPPYLTPPPTKLRAPSARPKAQVAFHSASCMTRITNCWTTFLTWSMGCYSSPFLTFASCLVAGSFLQGPRLKFGFLK